MKEKLQNEIKQLKYTIQKTQDIKELIELKRIMYKKKLELLDLIHTEEKARAGIPAYDLILKVDAMPTLPKFATGMTKVDTMLEGGFETGLFINLAGESGAGKTTLLLNLLSNLSQSRKTVFFNFEMGERMFAKKIKRMNLHETQLHNLIVDSETSDLNDLIMELELYASEGVKFFAIDSKMKITLNRGDSEVQKIEHMSKELARLAAKKDIVIFLINQMNEEDIKNKRLALKGSGAQKYDSDIVLFLVKEGEQRYLKCTKNRQNDKLFTVSISEQDYRLNDAPVVVEYQPSNENDFISNIA